MKKKTKKKLQKRGKQLGMFGNEAFSDIKNNKTPEWKKIFKRDKEDLNTTIKNLENRIINPEVNDENNRFIWQNNLVPAMNRFSGNFYSGENLWILWEKCKDHEYSTNHWATYRQWRKMGAHRKSKNENYTFIKLFLPKHGSNQMHLQPLPQTEKNNNSETRGYIVRYFRLYNADQVTWDINPGQIKIFPEQTNSYGIIESFIKSVGVKIISGDESTGYCKDLDIIKMPHKAKFLDGKFINGLDSYYSIIFQEIILWVIRKKISPTFESIDQPFQKLVAEIGGSMLSGIFQIQFKPNEENRIYYGSWQKILKSDVRFLYHLQNQALNAFVWLLSNTDALDLKIKERSLYPLPKKVVEHLNTIT